jgi:hypothetical protein
LDEQLMPGSNFTATHAKEEDDLSWLHDLKASAKQAAEPEPRQGGLI